VSGEDAHQLQDAAVADQEAHEEQDPGLQTFNKEVNILFNYPRRTERVDFKPNLITHLSYTTSSLKLHLSKWGAGATSANKLI
jgi:hypothetical protein